MQGQDVAGNDAPRAVFPSIVGRPYLASHLYNALRVAPVHYATRLPLLPLPVPPVLVSQSSQSSFLSRLTGPVVPVVSGSERLCSVVFWLLRLTAVSLQVVVVVIRLSGPALLLRPRPCSLVTVVVVVSSVRQSPPWRFALLLLSVVYVGPLGPLSSLRRAIRTHLAYMACYASSLGYC